MKIAPIAMLIGMSRLSHERNRVFLSATMSDILAVNTDTQAHTIRYRHVAYKHRHHAAYRQTHVAHISEPNEQATAK
jgi:hypothetical protein